VDGGLTVRGRTADVSLAVQFEISGGDFYAQASFDKNHAAFGMTPYTAFAGSVRNDDPLRFTFDLVGLSN
jgi:polyisoprenoid-binding protein YceI